MNLIAHPLTRRFWLISLLSLLALTLASCQPSQPICESTIHDVGDYENTCRMQVSPGAKSASLHLTAELEEGEMAWELAAPSGEVIWEGAAEKGKPVDVTHEVAEPEVGFYQLTLKLHAARGEYKAPWVVE